MDLIERPYCGRGAYIRYLEIVQGSLPSTDLANYLYAATSWSFTDTLQVGDNFSSQSQPRAHFHEMASLNN